MEASGSHKIMNFGPDIMRLYDSHTGAVIVYAHRTTGNLWHVHTGPSEDEEAEGVDQPTRGDAITAMVGMALAAVPQTGISVECPWGLAEMP